MRTEVDLSGVEVTQFERFQDLLVVRQHIIEQGHDDRLVQIHVDRACEGRRGDLSSDQMLSVQQLRLSPRSLPLYTTQLYNTIGQSTTMLTCVSDILPDSNIEALLFLDLSNCCPLPHLINKSPPSVLAPLQPKSCRHPSTSPPLKDSLRLLLSDPKLYRTPIPTRTPPVSPAQP